MWVGEPRGYGERMGCDTMQTVRAGSLDESCFVLEMYIASTRIFSLLSLVVAKSAGNKNPVLCQPHVRIAYHIPQDQSSL